MTSGEFDHEIKCSRSRVAYTFCAVWFAKLFTSHWDKSNSRVSERDRETHTCLGLVRRTYSVRNDVKWIHCHSHKFIALRFFSQFRTLHNNSTSITILITMITILTQTCLHEAMAQPYLIYQLPRFSSALPNRRDQYNDEMMVKLTYAWVLRKNTTHCT